MGSDIDLTKEIRSFCEKNSCGICPLYNMKGFCPITNPSHFYHSLRKKEEKNAKTTS